MKGLHWTEKRLKDGRTVRYWYAWRGGPRVTGTPDDAGFSDRYESVLAEHKRKLATESAIRVAKRDAEALLAMGSAQGDLKLLCKKIAKNAAARAKARGIDCSILWTDVADILRQNDFKCAISGIPFNLAHNALRQHSRNPFGPSLDRLDNASGYHRENIRIVITIVNYGINEWGLDAYLSVCRAVSKNNTTPSPATIGGGE
jgi:hypothetical protein